MCTMFRGELPAEDLLHDGKEGKDKGRRVAGWMRGVYHV